MGEGGQSSALSYQDELDVLKREEELIRKIVRYYQPYYNKHSLISQDMAQEARMAIIRKYRERKANQQAELGGYQYTIREACRRVLHESQPIITPMSWLKKGGVKAKQQDIPVIVSLDVLRENANDDVPRGEVGPVVSFEDYIILKEIIREMLTEIKPADAEVLTLLVDGYSNKEVGKILRKSTNYVSYHVKKIRNELRKRGVNYA